MIDYSVIMCSIIRDAEKELRRNIPEMTKALSSFRVWKALIFENNSVDKTRDLLEAWREQFPDNVILIPEEIDFDKDIPFPDGVNPFFSARRISKMVRLRNVYLDYIQRNDLKADFLIVADLDIAGFKADDIINCFKRCDEWDVVTANGYSVGKNLKKRYHDTFAYTSLDKSDKIQTEQDIYATGREIWKSLNSHAGQLMEVFSAYGGMAIYKFDLIKDKRYSLIYNKNDRVEVRCEHFALHRQLKEEDNARIVINPDFRIKYQSISVGLILSTLKRILKGK